MPLRFRSEVAARKALGAVLPSRFSRPPPFPDPVPLSWQQSCQEMASPHAHEWKEVRHGWLCTQCGSFLSWCVWAVFQQQWQGGLPVHRGKEKKST
jgi:hypothetical protein